MSNKRNFVKIGNIYESCESGRFKIVDKRKNDKGRFIYNIEFIKTGYKTSMRTHPRDGCNIKDYLKPNVGNIGYIGYVKNVIANYEKEYSFWERMINRCYNKNDKKYNTYGALGITVDERWHRFEYFLNDIQELPNWDKEKFYKNEISLDKDYKNYTQHNDIYSRDDCMWTSGTKNYMYQPHKQKLFKLTSPDGELIYYHFNLTDMAKKLDFMTRKGIENGLKRSKEHLYYGWYCEYVDIFPKGITPYNIENQFIGIKDMYIPVTPSKTSFLNYSGELKIKLINSIWTNKKTIFKAISPEGNVYYSYSIQKFINRFGIIKPKKLSRILLAGKKDYKGWEFSYIENLSNIITLNKTNTEFPNTI